MFAEEQMILSRHQYSPQSKSDSKKVFLSQPVSGFKVWQNKIVKSLEIFSGTRVRVRLKILQGDRQ